MPDRSRKAIDQEHRDDRGTDKGCDLRVVEEVHGDYDLLPDATRSDEPQNGRRTDVALPLVERERGEAAHGLWEPPEEKNLKRASTCGPQRLHRTIRHRLQRLTVELSQNTGGVYRQR